MFLFKRWTVPAIMLAATLLFAGCASGPPPIPRLAIAPEELSANFDETWEAVNDVLADMELPIKVIEKESGVVTTEFVSAGPRYAFFERTDDDGREISHYAKKTRYYVQIRVKQLADGAIRVTVVPHIEYMRYGLNKNWRTIPLGWDTCKSHGDIEQEFYDALKLKINTP